MKRPRTQHKVATPANWEERKEEERKEWAVLGYFVADTANKVTFDRRAEKEVGMLGRAAELKPLGVSVLIDFKAEKKGAFVASFVPGPPAQGSACNLWKACAEEGEGFEVERIPEPNMADHRVLRKFLEKGRETHPDKRYLVFIYGHGAGPLGLFDDSSSNGAPQTMRLDDAAEALDRAPAAVVLCRSCFMSTLETAIQLTGAASYLVGTQAIVPETGVWPWIGILSTLLGSADSAEVADAITLQVGSFYLERENRDEIGDVPYSLISVDKSRRLVSPMKQLCTELLEVRKGPEEVQRSVRAAIDKARYGTPTNKRSAGDPALVDLKAMCEELSKCREVSRAAAEVLEQLTPAVIPRHHSIQEAFSGVSLLYLPKDKKQIESSLFGNLGKKGLENWSDRYRGLMFCRETGWDKIALDPI